MKAFWNDEHGVILSAELVLIGTILVLGMVVGLVELQSAVVGELSDLGDAIGNVDQSYVIPGITSYKRNGGINARTAGARYDDFPDEGDCNAVITCDSGRGFNRGEKSGFGRAGGGSSMGPGNGMGRGGQQPRGQQLEGNRRNFGPGHLRRGAAGEGARGDFGPADNGARRDHSDHERGRPDRGQPRHEQRAGEQHSEQRGRPDARDHRGPGQQRGRIRYESGVRD